MRTRHRALRSLESRQARRPQEPADAGSILAEMSDNTVGGEKYEREWPERAADDVVMRSDPS